MFEVPRMLTSLNSKMEYSTHFSCHEFTAFERGDRSKGAGGEQNETGGLGGGGGWGLRSDAKGERKRWSEGVIEEVVSV
jgi:hypothetical protein